MKQFIGCDVHKKYSMFVSLDQAGRASRPVRVSHGGNELGEYLAGVAAGTRVAVETTGIGIGCWTRSGLLPRTWRMRWRPSA